MVSLPVTSAPADPAVAATAALPGVGAAPAGASAEPLALDFSALLAALLGGQTPETPLETTTGDDDASVADDGEATTPADPLAATGAATAAAAAAAAAVVAPVIATPLSAPTPTGEAVPDVVPVPDPAPASAAPVIAAPVTPAPAASDVDEPPIDVATAATPPAGEVGGAEPADPVAAPAAAPAAPAEAEPAPDDPPPAPREVASAAPAVTTADDATTTVQATRIAASPQATPPEPPHPARHGDAPAHPTSQAAAERVAAPAPSAPHAQTGGESTPERRSDGKGTAEAVAGDVPAELRDAAAQTGPAPARHAEAPQPHASSTPQATARDLPRDTPAPAAPPHPVRDVEQLVRLDALRPLRVVDGGEMRLEVRRPDVGQIDVHVSVRNDGVNATLLADQAGTREALTAQRPALEAALGRANLRLDGFSVGVGQQQHQSPQPDPQQQQTAPPPGGWRPDTAAATSPVAPIEPVRTWAGGLSLRA